MKKDLALIIHSSLISGYLFLGVVKIIYFRLGLGIVWILSISILIPILLIDSDSFRFQCD